MAWARMGCRILVVENNRQAAEGLREVLAAQGHAVASVGTGEAALEYLDVHSCDLVLLDSRLPGLSGHDTCARMRSRHGSRLPILMVADESDPDGARRSLESGADELVAPADPAALTLRVQGLLRSKALQDDLHQAREEAQARLRDMALLNEIGRDWSLIAEPWHFYRMVTQRLGLLIEAATCFIALHREDTDSFEAAIPAHGVSDEVLRGLRLDQRSLLPLLERGRAYISNDARSDARLPEGLAAALGADSLVLVPMLSEGGAVGLIAAANKPAPFTEDDVQLLMIFAGPAASFLRGRQIYAAQQRHVARLERLPWLMGTMASTTSRASLLELTTSFLQTELGYESVAFYAPASDDERRIECVTVTGEWEPGGAAIDPERIRWALQSGIALQAASAGGAFDLTIPVGVGVHAQGVLKVRRLGGPPEKDEVALLTTIAGQLGLALQRAESIAKTEGLARQMATLYDLALETGPLRDLKRLFVESTEKAGRLINADHVSALRFHPEDGTLRLFAAWARDPAAEHFADPEFRLGEGIAGRVAQDWLPAMINDVGQSGGFVQPSERNPIARILCVPLVYFDAEKAEPTLFAVLNASRQTGSPRFTHDELEYVQRFGSQLSVAVANAMAYAAEQERSTQLALINAVLGEIAENLSRDRILEAAVRRIHESFRLTLVMLAVPDPEAGLAHATMVAGPEPGRLLRQDYPLHDGSLGRALSEKRTFLVADASKDADFRPLLDSTLCALTIPILSGEEPMAVLCVESDVPGFFGRSELLTLQTLAEGIGIILRNAQLYGALEETNARLVELDRLKSELVNVVAHDFRSPLAGVLGHAEILASSLEGEPLHSARSIINAATHMATLVDKTLVTTRLESGRFPLDFEVAELGSIFREVLGRRLVDPLHPLTADLPTDPIAIWADRDRLAEVIENLLSNAAKYSPQGGPITVRGRVEGEAATVSVEDSGLGVAPEDLGRLFLPFSRIRNPGTAGIEGAGLGLHICDRIVRAHGGRFHVESQPGRGSVFSFTIPVYGLVAQAPQAVVLVASDAATRRDVRDVAERLGYRVQEAQDGVGLVEDSVRLRPAAIFADRILPRLRAEEVAERLRGFPATAQVPLFVLSARDDGGPAPGPLGGYLRKPIDPARLKEILLGLRAGTPPALSRPDPDLQPT
ncbi:MAG TPA: GAF domain-containing protein [Vicinamibacteria bacterium]|nr:GAF domain-containing protein [Vicinamibacteria bacterium]